jgi:hypothetical protein
VSSGEGVGDSAASTIRTGRARSFRETAMDYLRALTILALLTLGVLAFFGAMKHGTLEGIVACAAALAFTGAGALITAVIRERRPPPL